MKQNIFIQHIEAIAPLKGACSWDCSGLQVMSTREAIHTCVVSLDLTADVLEYAISINADIIISHHPLSLSPLLLHSPSPYLPLIHMLHQHNIAFYVAHTSLDATTHSISGFLAQMLALDSLEPIEITYTDYIFAFTIYVIDKDQECLAKNIQSSGIEYHLFLRDSSSCTILIDAMYVSDIQALLEKAHLMYSKTSTQHISRHFGIGCIGKCSPALSKEALFTILKDECNIHHAHLYGNLPQKIHRIAYCPGAGSSFIQQLHTYPEPIDVYITGEIKHHDGIYSQIPLLDVGHFGLEETMMRYFSKALQEMCQEVSVEMYSSTPPFAYTAL